MKRVLCLYRVSTKGQVDEKDDIPRQRRECHDFIDKMMNAWKKAFPDLRLPPANAMKFKRFAL